MPNDTLSRLQLDIKVATGKQSTRRAEEVNVEPENDWEELIEIICVTFGTNRSDLAQRAGFDPSTLRQKTKYPTERFLDALWPVILQLAAERDQEQDYGLRVLFGNQSMKDAFYNSASRSSPEQKAFAKQKRQVMREKNMQLKEIKKQDQQIAQRKALLEEQDRLILKKSAELAALQSDEERRAQALQLLQEIEEEKNSEYTRRGDQP